MWFVFTLIALFGWGFADMLYKMGTVENDPHSFLKITVWVGIFMGVLSIILLPFSESGLPLFKLLFAYGGAVYSSLFYIASMIFGYAGIKYLEISILSPVENASGAVSMLGMIVFFSLRGKYSSVADVMGKADFIGVILCVAGIVLLAVVEKNILDRYERVGVDSVITKDSGMKEAGREHVRRNKLGVVALVFPLIYCVLDSVGTAINGIALDSDFGGSLGEIDNQIIYGFYFLAAAIIIWIYLRLKTGEFYNPFKKTEKVRAAAGFVETAANIFYIYAIAREPVLVAPIIGSYCIVSMAFSRIFLKEKLYKEQYICLFMVIAGIVILGISEVI